MRIGAGTLAGEVLIKAQKYGLRLVAGSCPTIGLIVGYTQGSDHSLLSDVDSLRTDNILE